MKVRELIEMLKEMPQDLQVAYHKHSEQCLLDSSGIYIFTGCKPRPDGWIQDYRGDMPTQKYLMLPGN